MRKKVRYEVRLVYFEYGRANLESFELEGNFYDPYYTLKLELSYYEFPWVAAVRSESPDIEEIGYEALHGPPVSSGAGPLGTKSGEELWKFLDPDGPFCKVARHFG